MPFLWLFGANVEISIRLTAQLREKQAWSASLAKMNVCLISECLDDFTGWTTSVEVLPYDTSGIPEGAVICALPQYR